MVLSLLQALLENAGVLVLPIFVTFPFLVLSVLAVSVIVTLFTPPTPMETQVEFYRRVQPAGTWGVVAQRLREQDPTFKKETPFRIDLLNVVLAVPWLAALYTTPILFITHRFREALFGAALFLGLSIALAFTWWPNLPPKDAELAPLGQKGSSHDTA